METHHLPSSVPESQVLIIMTGGTICMQRSPSGFVPARGFQETCLAKIPSFNDGARPPLEPMTVVVNAAGETKKYASLRTPPSLYERQVRYTVLEFEELLDSSSIDSKGWAEIAQTIYNNYTSFDAFVVLHGTDSLAYTCSALSFMLQELGKPVILTGSQAPMLELQNDASDNLLGSLVVAGHFMIPEVCLYFNHKLFRGNRATKVAASDFAAFDSPNAPPLAVTTSMRTLVNWDLVRRPTSLEHFSIRTNLDTSHVACLRIFPGIQPEMVDAVLRLDGLRGLVLETFGAGNAPGGKDNAMTKVLASAIQRGIVIVNITQCLSGHVSPVYAPGMTLFRAGVVAGQDMTTEAALTKMAYLLAQPESTPESVAKEMSVSHRGELTNHSQTVFRHPDGTLSERLTTLTALGYAIAQGDLDKVQELVKAENMWILNDADYSGNTPVVRSLSLLFLSKVITNWSAHRGTLAVTRDPAIFPSARCLCTPAQQYRPHAALPGSQRRAVGTCGAAAQVRGASSRRRAARGRDAGAAASGRVGTGWGAREDAQGARAGRAGGVVMDDYGRVGAVIYRHCCRQRR